MPATLPRPLAELPRERLRGVVGVMTDIDDTLTRDGAIEAAALAALQALPMQRAGWRIGDEIAL